MEQLALPQPKCGGGRRDVNEHRLRSQELLHGLGIRGRNRSTDRIVGVVLETGEEQADFAITVGRRALAPSRGASRTASMARAAARTWAPVAK